MGDEYTIKLPDSLEAGVYANALHAWHTSSEFTLDFITAPIDSDTRELGLVVSRIKIPTISIFDLIRRLNREMTEYERKFGEIRQIERAGDDESEES